MIVVTDTGPIHYLILIGQINLLPLLYESLIIPDAVRLELYSLNAFPLPLPPGQIEQSVDWHRLA
jgi:predicted nucleic acid-binding protein